MNNDINIIPILMEYDEGVVDKISKDSFYEVEDFGEDNFLKFAYGISLNGRPIEDYNIYAIINAYDEDKGRYNIFAGGFKLSKDITYGGTVFKRHFIRFLDKMKKNMDLTLYKIPTELDISNPDLREGDFDDLENIKVDLKVFQSLGIFTSATTFKIKTR